MCGSENITRLLGTVVLACVIFVDTPAMGGIERSTMLIVANGGL